MKKDYAKKIILTVLLIIVLAFYTSFLLSFLESLGFAFYLPSNKTVLLEDKKSEHAIRDFVKKGLITGGNLTGIFANKTCVGGICNKLLEKLVDLRSHPSEGPPLFLILNSYHTSYYRMGVSSTYNNGAWLVEEKGFISYNEKVKTVPVLNLQTKVDEVTIIPLKNFSGLVPVPAPKYASNLNISCREIKYSPDLIIFRCKGVLSPYSLKSIQYIYTSDTLASDEVYVLDSKYLEVPDYLKANLSRILEKIADEEMSVHERILKTMNFLKTNYEYDLKFPEAPAGVDPIIWFLFYSKKGVCIHFNSAFVMLLRMQGIPARLVLGFAINPGAQTLVTPMNLHAWTEVYFKKLGWVSFDATSGFRIGRELKKAGEKLFSIDVKPDEVIAKKGDVVNFVVKLIADSNFPNDVYLSYKAPKAFYVNLKSDKICIYKEAVGSITVGEVPPRVYKIKFSGATSDGAIAEDVMTIIIPEINDFVLMLNTTQIDIVRGEESKIKISVLKIGNFNKRVSLSYSVCPDFKIVLDKQKEIPSFNATISITAYDAQIGDYNITFTGRSEDGKVKTVILKVRVKARTLINITFVRPEEQVKGGHVYVSGYLVDEEGIPLSDKKVEVYIMKEKGEKGVKIGEGYTINGFYNITAEIPENVLPGEYLIEARFEGDEYYESSSSDPKIKILAKTEIKTMFDKIVFKDSLENIPFSGLLRDSSHYPLSNQKIIIYVNGSIKYETRTNSYGMFVFYFRPEKTGVYNITVYYPGSNYYLSSSRSELVNVVYLNIKPSDLIRGEKATVSLNIKDCKLAECKFVRVEFSGEAFNVSLNNGSSEFQVYVGNTTKLGIHPVFLYFPYANITYITYFKIFAKTSIEVFNLESGKPGEFFVIKGRIVDYYFPSIGFGNVEIIIGNKTCKTNSTGYFEAPILIPKNISDSKYETVILFKGKDFLLPSSTTVEINVSKPADYMYVLIVFFVLSLVSPIIYVNFRGKRKMSVTTLTKREANDKVKIFFREIAHDLPNVWGVNDSITIEARHSEEEIEIFKFYINGEHVYTGKSFVYNFSNKGKYRIEAFANGDKGVAELRIVDYKEEIVRLYNDIFLKWAEGKGVKVENLTPYEIAHALSSLGYDAKILGTIARIFSFADYSLYPIKRVDYEVFYHLLKTLIGGLNEETS